MWKAVREFMLSEIFSGSLACARIMGTVRAAAATQQSVILFISFFLS
jgi:hypothetical protein